MAILEISNLTKYYPGRTLIEESSLIIHKGERCVLLGRNGCGKSSIIKIITGELDYDGGNVHLRGTVSCLSQFSIADKNQTAIEYVLAGMTKLNTISKKIQQLEINLEDPTNQNEYNDLIKEFNQLGGKRKEEIAKTKLTELGLSDIHFDKPLSKLSGGQKQKVFLTAVALSSEDLLILDEPTNHLDIGAIEWLEKFLLSYPGAVLFVSHDSRFVEKCATKIFSITNNKIETYNGKYTNFIQWAEEKNDFLLKEYLKQQELIKKESDLIAKFQSGTRATMAQSRIKKLEKLSLIDAPISTKQIRKIIFDNKKEELPKEVIRVRALSYKWPEAEEMLFDEVNFTLFKKDRIAFLGPNGCGKSTFIKAILGQLTTKHSVLDIHPRLTVGYFDQEFSHLINTHSPYSFLREKYRTLSEDEIRTKLGTFLFSGEDAFEPIKNLSGGEKARLQILDILFSEPDILVFDEPTNNLDMTTISVLTNAIASFDGPVVLITHDRNLVDSTCNTILYINKKTVHRIDGNYTENKEKVLELVFAKDPSVAKVPNSKSDKPKSEKKINKYKLEEIEAKIFELESTRDSLQIQFENPETYKDPLKITNLQHKIATIESELKLLYNDWEDICNPQ